MKWTIGIGIAASIIPNPTRTPLSIFSLYPVPMQPSLADLFSNTT
jgi:hypothetical protein